VLAAKPNDLLLSEGKPPPQSAREQLLARIGAASGNLSLSELQLVACLIECVSVYRQTRRHGQGKKGPRRRRPELLVDRLEIEWARAAEGAGTHPLLHLPHTYL